MKANCLTEVQALHQFFQDWFRGVLPDTDEVYARLTAVLHETFVIISPDGTLSRREDLVTTLRLAYGQRPLIRIWVQNLQYRPIIPTIGLVMYEEWQTDNGKTTSRLSSALFRANTKTPQGVEWLHVHETWFDNIP